MQLKEGEITIASGFMDAVLIPAQEMAVNLQEMVVQVVCTNIINVYNHLFLTNSFIIWFLKSYCIGDKEETENEVGEQPRRYRQPRQQNWYNSYRGNRRGPPPNRGEGGDYNVRTSYNMIISKMLIIAINK